MDVVVEPAPPLGEVLALYAAVGWTAYTDRPDDLAVSLAGSHLVLTARVDGEVGGSVRELVGLARTVSDGATICYLQDILVHPDHRRSGVGRRLMAEVLARYARCRQLVLTTEAGDPRAHAFYRSVGLVGFDESGSAGFIRPRGITGPAPR